MDQYGNIQHTFNSLRKQLKIAEDALKEIARREAIGKSFTSETGKIAQEALDQINSAI